MVLLLRGFNFIAFFRTDDAGPSGGLWMSSYRYWKANSCLHQSFLDEYIYPCTIDTEKYNEVFILRGKWIQGVFTIF